MEDRSEKDESESEDVPPVGGSEVTFEFLELRVEVGSDLFVGGP